MQEEKIEFLHNRCRESIEGKVVPEYVEEWVETEGFGNQEEGYLVRHNEIYGFLYVEEYSHDKQTFEEERNFAVEHGLTSQNVLRELKERAEQLSNEVEPSIVIMVGEGTGFAESHELAVFFPYETSGEAYRKTVQELIEKSA